MEDTMSDIELQEMIRNIVRIELELNNDVLVKRIFGMTKDVVARGTDEVLSNINKGTDYGMTAEEIDTDELIKMNQDMIAKIDKIINTKIPVKYFKKYIKSEENV